jgi:uncharacterized protein
MVENQLSRRKFLSGLGSGIAISQFSNWNRDYLFADSSSLKSNSYLDFHVHLVHQWHGKDEGPINADVLIRWMDLHQIEKAVVLPLVSPEAFWYPISSEYVISESKQYPDRLIPFCAIDPRTLSTHLTTQKDVVDMLKRYQDAGVKGFGEHKPKLPVDHELNMRLYDACSEVGFPVLFHLDNNANMDKPGLPGLEKALKSFPKLKMVGHGKGWWASISGNLKQSDLHVGYPAGKVNQGGAIDRLMEKYENLYGDLSSSGAHALFRDPEFGSEFLKRRADRLLFGTDFYSLTQKSFKQFEIFSEFSVSQTIREKICQKNGLNILS